MDPAQLISETNALLTRLLELEDARKAQAAQNREQLEKMYLGRRSFTGSESDGEKSASGDWKERMDAMLEKSRERFEGSAKKEQEYRDLLLQELSQQTELLRKIEAHLSK